MQIACPRCDEGYRIEPARLPGPRVRVACIACGEPLFLRVIEGGAGGSAKSPVVGRGGAAPGAAATVEEEVPIWTEPSPAAVETAPEPSIAQVPAEPYRVEAEASVEPPLAAMEQAAPVADPSFPPVEPLESVPETLGAMLEPPAPVAEPVAFAAPVAEPAVESSGGFTFSQVGDVSARAQRLARALVSDILVYHPKKVERALQESQLKELMKEEVEKSWDEYCERLGPELARANRQQFVNALNEILAHGKQLF